MASTLYLQLPSKSVAASLDAWTDHAWHYCVATDKQVLESGHKNIAGLTTLGVNVQRLVLLVATCDVSFFAVKVPPIPFAKIKLALPNLLEEQVLSEPSELLFIPSPPQDGVCQVAVVAKSWMEQVFAAVRVLGINHVNAYTVAEAMGGGADTAILAVESALSGQAVFDFSVRPAAVIKTEGNAGDELSLPAGLSLDLRAYQREQDAQNLTSGFASAVQQAVQLLVPEGDFILFADAQLEPVLQGDTELNALQPRLQKIQKFDWTTKIAGLTNASLDLFANLRVEGKHSVDWKRWRWSLGLSGLIVLVVMLGLNLEWWKLQREYDAVRNSTTTTYKTAFPNETVIRDPLAQLQQKMSAARKLTGQSSSDDFLVLGAQFAQVWDMVVGAQMSATVNSVEYREKSLWVTPKAGTDVPVDRLRAALKEKNLSLDVKEAVLKVSVEIGGVR